MKPLLLVCVLVCVVSSLVSCEPCIGSGSNGFSDPGADEYQLVMDNHVSRITEICVDGEKVADVCQETNNITVGNFAVDTCSRIMAHSRVTNSDCYFSPNCTGACSEQECEPDTCADTTPFAGRILHLSLVWAY